MTEAPVPSPRLPIRTCVGCRAAVPQRELVRVAVAGQRAVADLRRRLPGRGAYVHARPACLAAAGKGGLARSLRRTVTRAELEGLARAVAGGPADPGAVPSGQRPGNAVESGSPSSPEAGTCVLPGAPAGSLSNQPPQVSATTSHTETTRE